MSRQQRAQIAQETLTILDTGAYLLPDQRCVSIEDAVTRACAQTLLYRPADYQALLTDIESLPSHASTTIMVRNCTTFAAAAALTEQYASVVCLNFASAKNPGGGFQGGSQAQEESLARASALYATLQTQPDFYAYHRHLRSSLYSDHVIFSPNVPVFRDDDDRLLDAPWTTHIITAPAVNAGAVRKNEPDRLDWVVPAMQHRARMILAIAARHQCEALVLGAWGCGVFKIDPAILAGIFAAVLAEEPFRHRFRHVEFAVYDRTPAQTTINAFLKVFGTANR